MKQDKAFWQEKIEKTEKRLRILRGKLRRQELGGNKSQDTLKKIESKENALQIYQRELGKLQGNNHE